MGPTWFEITSLIFLPLNTAMLIKLIFAAGRLVQKVEDHGLRINSLESALMRHVQKGNF